MLVKVVINCNLAADYFSWIFMTPALHFMSVSNISQYFLVSTLCFGYYMKHKTSDNFLRKLKVIRRWCESMNDRIIIKIKLTVFLLSCQKVNGQSKIRHTKTRSKDTHNAFKNFVIREDRIVSVVRGR